MPGGRAHEAFHLVSFVSIHDDIELCSHFDCPKDWLLSLRDSTYNCGPCFTTLRVCLTYLFTGFWIQDLPMSCLLKRINGFYLVLWNRNIHSCFDKPWSLYLKGGKKTKIYQSKGGSPPPVQEAIYIALINMRYHNDTLCITPHVL